MMKHKKNKLRQCQGFYALKTIMTLASAQSSQSKEIAKFSQHAAQWWDLNGPFKTLHHLNPTRLAFILKHKPSLEGLSILDLGCGGGILTEALAKQGALLTGIDLSEEGIAAAKRHASSQALNIDYFCTAIEDYEHPPFDLIVCMEMLEHVDHPQVILNQCKRLLKPGGYLFLSTLHRNMKSYALAILAAEYILGLLPRQTHDFQKFIKPSELAQMLRTLDFELKGLSGLSYNPFSHQASLCKEVSVNYLMAAQLNN